MIGIRGLHKYFNKGRQNEIHVINNVDIELPEKGMVAVFGKSGCGKTTLLNCIGGLDRFAEGSISIDGNDITKDTDTVRNKYIGYIFQNYNLNNEESCFDNVANALRLCGMTDEDEIYDRVMAALKNVGLTQYAKRPPDTLSGGQQQRIAIARAIVKNPKIILADEPTGNLDEANTVMIMDLLRAIAEEHLVILVTHEANLVDYYCDTVIELSDGQIVNVKRNSSARGFAARDKNTIFLGELEKKELSDGNTEIEYYGDAPDEPIKLKIVNNGGKLYIKLESSKVQLIDEYSEVKLYNGVYEGDASTNKVSEELDMSHIPPVDGNRFGHLFNFKSSVKSGYRANFNSGTKKKKLLRRCMCLFAAVIVIMTATFGTSIKSIINAKSSYNHNVFYIYTGDVATSEKIYGAVGKENSGIDYIRLCPAYGTGDSSVYFNTGSFESFNKYDYSSTFFTNAVYLDQSLAKDLKLVAGKRDGLADHEMLISTRVADALLEKSALGYIEKRSDLIGLISTVLMVDGRSTTIAGIVESDESAIYLTPLAMAKFVKGQVYTSLTSLGSDYKINVKDGETVLAIKSDRNGVKYPVAGDSVMIQGKELKVSSVIRFYDNYDIWLAGNGIYKNDESTFFEKLVLSENPDVVKDSAEYTEIYDEVFNKRYFEYWDYYYAELPEFIGSYFLFQPHEMNAWLFVSRGVDVAKHAFTTEQYYKACKFKELNGRYPGIIELDEMAHTLPYLDFELNEYYNTIGEEMYLESSGGDIYINTYMVSDKDYIELSQHLGETHPSAMRDSVGADAYYEKAADAYRDTEVVYVSSAEEPCYTVIHSSSPELTEKWIQQNFGDLKSPNEYTAAIITPDDAFEQRIYYEKVQIVAGLISMAVMLVIMSVCMYFIMRSSLMIRIKEVGIYRAIGVSKKNMIYKFLVESAVLATLTVFLGYLCTSVFIFAVSGSSGTVMQIFFYPWWMALAVLAVLGALSLFFGVLPIMLLLRKTPSEILAKYDI